MFKLISFLIAFLLVTGCSSKPTPVAFNVREEFADILAPKFELSDSLAPKKEDVRLLFITLSKAKSEYQILLGTITRVEFVSATEAKVNFLWSGGRHAGSYIMKMKGRAWFIVDDFHSAMIQKPEPIQRGTDNDGAVPHRV